jgi:hypothetical protein
MGWIAFTAKVRPIKNTLLLSGGGVTLMRRIAGAATALRSKLRRQGADYNLSIVDVVFKILSALRTVLGGCALIRSYGLTRSKLALLQKTDKGHNQYDGSLWKLEVFTSNLSSQGNAIVGWRAWLKDKDGILTEIGVQRAMSQIQRRGKWTGFSMPRTSTQTITPLLHAN